MLQRKHKCAATLLLCAIILSNLNACSSPIIFHDTPLSDRVETDSTTPETDPSDRPPVITDPVTDPDGPTTDTPTDPDADAKEALSALRREDLDGMNILIASAADSAVFGDIFGADDKRGTVLSDLRRSRTQMVEQRYNVRILNFTFERDALYTEIRKAYLSDVPYVADFYAIPYGQLGKFQAEGMLLNLRMLPFTDFSAPYFDQDAMAAMSAGHAVWGAVGNYTFSPENYYAIFFNRPLSQSLSLTSPYELVKNGTWTWETLMTASLDARAALDENGAQTVWGDNLANLGLDVCEPLFMDSGAICITQSAPDTTPALSFDLDSVSSVITLLRSGVHESSVSPKDGAEDAFTSGNLLYYCGTLSNMSRWSDIAVPWGLVPLPKLNESQNGYSTYVGESAVLCVPSTTGALEETGMIMQALFAASSGNSLDLYLNEALQYFVRDSATVEMLDLICSAPRYDFTTMFAGGYNYLNRVSADLVHSGITLNYAPKTVYNNYKAYAEKELTAAFPLND